MPALQTVTSRFLRHAGSAIVELTAWSLACFCDAYPEVDAKRQLSQMRMLLARYQFRVSELEEQVSNFKAMHELQHGTTVELPLTAESFIVKHRDLN